MDAIIWAEGDEHMAVVVDKDNCLCCGECAGRCPTGAMKINGDGKAECSADECVDCRACIDACPAGAIIDR